MSERLRAVLFDLDDTLLGNHMDRFLQGYFGLLVPHVAQLVPPEKFMPALLAATRTMVEHTDPQVTNQQAFMADFLPRVGRTADEMLPVFESFYAIKFGALRGLTQPRPEARAAVLAALDAGCDVVVATNPLFPETAIRQRMEWANVADLPFKLVTSYEIMHSAKPHARYYAEIAKHMGREPGECVMVGDDWANDIAPAMQIGLRAYWLNLADEMPTGANCGRGTLAQFPAWAFGPIDTKSIRI
jgi:HAD superfamily hydrolase (TIGR01549 family)